MSVIGKLHNYERLIYIFTGKFENGIPIIFNKTMYHYWYKELRNKCSPILINTTHKNTHFKIKLKGKFQRVVQFTQKQ